MLVYDGDCRFCVAAVLRLERWFEPAAPRVAWQQADLDALGLTAEESRAAVQWVSGDQHVSGADAVSAWLRTGKKLKPITATFPLLLPIGRLLYPVVARNRGRLSRALRVRR
jgi:predicted DCC family thiol-disulfide oxidoreductase YuxK